MICGPGPWYMDTTSCPSSFTNIWNDLEIPIPLCFSPSIMIKFQSVGPTALQTYLSPYIYYYPVPDVCHHSSETDVNSDRYFPPPSPLNLHLLSAVCGSFLRPAPGQEEPTMLPSGVQNGCWTLISWIFFDRTENTENICTQILTIWKWESYSNKSNYIIKITCRTLHRVENTWNLIDY